MMADERDDGPEDGRKEGESGARRMTAEDLVPGLAEAAAAEDAQQLEAELESLRAERDDLKDKLMRALAETENVRKRAERDAKDAATYGGTKLARDLLAVHDNLERALEHADAPLRENHPGFLEGVELTHRELLNAFSKHLIEKVAPEKGEKFDPNRHQAMFEIPTGEVPPGSVVQVMQAGFVIGDRLLRPAMVGVAKAAPEAGEPEDGAAEAAGGATGPAAEGDRTGTAD
jgi:molecular chaperone GrpE